MQSLKHATDFRRVHPGGSQLSSYQTQCHENGISFGLAPMESHLAATKPAATLMESQLSSYQPRHHADAISIGLVPMGSQLAATNPATTQMQISIGLAPMESQLGSYNNRGFRRGEPAGEQEAVSAGILW